MIHGFGPISIESAQPDGVTIGLGWTVKICLYTKELRVFVCDVFSRFDRTNSSNVARSLIGNWVEGRGIVDVRVEKNFARQSRGAA